MTLQIMDNATPDVRLCDEHALPFADQGLVRLRPRGYTRTVETIATPGRLCHSHAAVRPGHLRSIENHNRLTVQRVEGVASYDRVVGRTR